MFSQCWWTIIFVSGAQFHFDLCQKFFLLWILRLLWERTAVLAISVFIPCYRLKIPNKLLSVLVSWCCHTQTYKALCLFTNTLTGKLWEHTTLIQRNYMALICAWVYLIIHAEIVTLSRRCALELGVLFFNKAIYTAKVWAQPDATCRTWTCPRKSWSVDHPGICVGVIVEEYNPYQRQPWATRCGKCSIHRQHSNGLEIYKNAKQSVLLS